ncbi:unnamed protein product, partial [marine sediment metagenome]
MKIYSSISTALQSDYHIATYVHRLKFIPQLKHNSKPNSRDNKEQVLNDLYRLKSTILSFSGAAPSPVLRCVFSSVKTELWEDEDFTMKAIDLFAEAVMFVKGKLWQNESFVIKAVRYNFKLLKCASPALRANSNVVLNSIRALKIDSGEKLSYFNLELINYYISHELWKNRDFILAAVKYHWTFLQNASPTLRSDKQLVLLAMKTLPQDSNNKRMKHFFNSVVGKSLWGEHSFILEALKFDWRLLKNIDHKLCSNSQVVMAAINNIRYIADDEINIL